MIIIPTKKLLLFGAGKVGRSLIGQLFSSSGYEVVFVDVDDTLVKALNEKRSYFVEIIAVHERKIFVVICRNFRYFHDIIVFGHIFLSNLSFFTETNIGLKMR